MRRRRRKGQDMSALTSAVSVFGSLLLPCLAHAQCLELVLQPTTPGTLRFGVSTALDGDTLVVASPTASVQAVVDGAVFVYRKLGTDWIEAQVLTSGDPVDSQFFGRAVALDGGTLMVQADRQSATMAPPGGGGSLCIRRAGRFVGADATHFRSSSFKLIDRPFWGLYSIARRPGLLLQSMARGRSRMPT